MLTKQTVRPWRQILGTVKAISEHRGQEGEQCQREASSISLTARHHWCPVGNFCIISTFLLLEAKEVCVT